jgi:hypothetical protein
VSNKSLYILTGIFLFWTAFCVRFGLEQGRQQTVDSKVKCVAVYDNEAST